MNKGINFKFKTCKSYVFTIALYGKFKLSQDSGTKHAQIFQIWMFCKLHGILDNINMEKYDHPMQIKFLYLALFANFCHQSMHQVLQGTLKRSVFLVTFPCSIPKALNAAAP